MIAVRTPVNAEELQPDPAGPSVSFPLIDERSVAQFTTADVSVTSVRYEYRFKVELAVADADTAESIGATIAAAAATETKAALRRQPVNRGARDEDMLISQKSGGRPRVKISEWCGVMIAATSVEPPGNHT